MVPDATKIYIQNSAELVSRQKDERAFQIKGNLYDY